MADIWLANLILVLHFVFVLGVVFPVPLIAVGAWRKWRWIRNRKFRLVHIVMIGVVVTESLIGMFCPLTVWEQALRQRSGGPVYAESFIEHWLSRFLYFEFEAWVFTVVYVGWGLLTLILWIWVPPEKRKKAPLPSQALQR